MMSDLEKTGQNLADEPAIVIVEKDPLMNSKQKLFRPTELQEDSPDLSRMRSKAPAVSSLSEDVKSMAANFATTKNPVESMTLKDSRHRGNIMEKQSAGSSGKHKHRVSKKSSSKRRGDITPAEDMPLRDMDSDPSRKEKSGIPAQPIPSDVKSITSVTLNAPTKGGEKRVDDDYTDEVGELRTPRPAEKIIDWSDDGEAGGLPRSESRASRASRVSRAVRQLFCCGVAYSPPSEDEISSHRISGI